jgi:hypothetical protein
VTELAKYKLDLMTVEDGRWDRGGSEPADDFTDTRGEVSTFSELIFKLALHDRRPTTNIPNNLWCLR